MSTVETDIYCDNEIHVTTARVIVGEATYALRNVASVSIRENVPQNNNACGIGCIVFGAAFGLLFLFLIAVSGSHMTADAPFMLLILAGVPIGLGLINLARSDTRPTYSLMISSSSGEVQAFTSED